MKADLPKQDTSHFEQKKTKAFLQKEFKKKSRFKFKSKFKHFLVSGVILLLLLGGAAGYYLMNQQGVGDVRQQASGVTKTVCPSGTAGENGCDYIGGEGIQQAIVQAPNNSTIFIKNGAYTRDNHSNYQKGDDNFKAYLFLNQDKTIIIEGESREGVVIDGQGYPHARFGLIATKGKLTLKNLTISNNALDGVCLASSSQVNIDSSTISNNDQSGVHLKDSSQATIDHSTISNNQGIGVYLVDSSQATISSSTISNNALYGVFLADSSQATITNNTFYNNRVAGVSAYKCSDDNPSVEVINNIITHTKKNDDNSFGFAIGGSCFHEKRENVTVHHNLVWANEGAGTDCQNDELCTFPEKIEVNPQYQDPQSGDFTPLNAQVCTAGIGGIHLGAIGCEQKPIGYLGYANCEQIQGWTYDPDDVDQPLEVQFYLEEYHSFNQYGQDIFLGSVVADHSRPDLGLSNNNHGYVFRWDNMTDSAKQAFYSDFNGGRPVTISAFALDPSDSSQKTKLTVGRYDNNSSMEQLGDTGFPVSWQGWHSGLWGLCDNDGTIESVTNEKRSGDRAVKMNGHHVNCSRSNMSVLQFFQNLPPMEPGRKYRVSAWVKPISMNHLPQVVFQKRIANYRVWGNNNDPEITTQTIIQNIDPNNQQWQQVVYHVTPGSVWNKIDVQAIKHDSFYLDDVRVSPIEDQSFSLKCQAPDGQDPPVTPSVQPTTQPTTPPSEPTTPPNGPTDTPQAKCTNSEDCDDSNPCTTDVCFGLGNSQKICQNQPNNEATCGTHQKCVDGSCSDSCQDDWNDCNHDLSDGCETNGSCELSGGNQLNFKLSLAGVPKVEYDLQNQPVNTFHPNQAGQSIEVDLTLKDLTGSVVEQGRKTLVYQQEGEGGVSSYYKLREPLRIVQPDSGKLSLLIKGPMHRQIKYCRNNQQSDQLCGSQEGFSLNLGINTLDLTQRPLQAGDVPMHGENQSEQDGVVNSLDYSFVVGCLSTQSDPACVSRADFDYSGKVTNYDLSLVIDTLSSAPDDL
ncbi:MAG: DUF5123 domain-containing protein [Candidatus Pacebacteria bacterium]|nr:DUF5123 domain-containing protein [Candidatus Paceibacterota bacterium]